MSEVFRFGAAAELYSKHEHPRVLCDARSLARLREQVRVGDGRRIMDALREKVRPMIAEVLAAKEVTPLVRLRRGKEVGSGLALPFVADIAMVAVLDHDADAAEAVRRVLAAVPEVSRNEPHDRISLGFSNYGHIGLAWDLLHAELPETERAAIATWLTETSVRETLGVLVKMRYLRHAGMNIPMDGMITALVNLLAVEGDPGVPDLSAERATLIQFLEATINCAYGPEGYPSEDIGYGTEMACLLAPAIEAVRRAGHFDVYAECPRWRKFGRAVVHFTQPWGGRLSNTGDFGADFGVTSMVLPRLAQETRDPTLMWLHGTTPYPLVAAGPWGTIAQMRTRYPQSKLADDFLVPIDSFSLLTLDALSIRPEPPSRARMATHFMDPERGIVSFRSDWTRDATFVVFDGAHRPAAAQGHAHDSGSHFALSALGEYFAIGTGRYNIEQEHHNVVIVDGKSGHVGDGSWVASRYQANLVGYWPGDFVDSARVVNSQMSDCYWSKRTLLLVKGDHAPSYAVTIDDVNKADDFREFWWLLNAHPDSKIEIHGDWATIIGATHGNLLDVRFALPSPHEYNRPHLLRIDQNVQLGGSPREYGGDPKWAAKAYRELIGNLEYGPVFERPRLNAKVSGLNGRFMAMMLPRRAGEAPANCERLASLDGSLAVRLTFEKVEDTLIWAYDHRMLEAGGVVARGGWCVVRRDRATGRVLRHALHEGERLRVDGKVFIST